MSDADRPLKILHIASSQRWTGVAEPAARLAREQLLHGNEVWFACVGGSSFEKRLGSLKVPFVGDFRLDRALNPANLRQDLSALRRWIERNEPHIIHCHLPHDHWLAALALRRPLVRFGTRVAPAIVRTVHRASKPRRDMPHRWLMGKGADMVIAVSQASREALINDVGLPPSKVAWVRGAVNLEKFRPDLDGTPIRTMYKIPERARVAGLVARMQAHRGHHALLDTLDEVVEAVPRAFYALAGRGEIKGELVARIRGHALRGKNVRRLGYHKKDLQLLYAAMDVAVLMTPGSDGSCRAMLEAMACGKPVIGANVGAIKDSVKTGETGWLFEKDDKERLAAALIEALGNLEKTRKLGEQARQFVEKNHSLEGQYIETMKAYREALGKRAKMLGGKSN